MNDSQMQKTPGAVAGRLSRALKLVRSGRSGTALQFWLVLLGVFTPVVLVVLSSHSPGTWRSDLMLNAAAMLLSTFLAVSIIDWILARRLEIKWSPITELAHQRVSALANKAITAVVELYRVPESLEISRLVPGTDIGEIFVDRVAFVRDELLPNLASMTPTIPNRRWGEYCRTLSQLEADIDTGLTLFGERLPPSIQQRLITLSKLTTGCEGVMGILIDYMGVAEEDAPPNSLYTAAEMAELGNSLACQEVGKVLEVSVEILERNVQTGTGLRLD